MLQVQYSQSAFSSLSNVFIIIIWLYPANNSVTEANQVLIHSPGHYQTIMKTLLCTRSYARCREHMCKMWQKGKLRLREMRWLCQREQSYSVEELELTPSSTRWLEALSLSPQPHCPFLHKEIESEDPPFPVTLSIFFSSPDLHIAKWWNYTVHNSTATLLL